MEDNQKIKKDLSNEIFWKSFGTIFVFAVPAVVAALLGLRLDEAYESGRKITISLLIFSFLTSWMIIIFQYRAMSKRIENMENSSKSIKA